MPVALKVCVVFCANISLLSSGNGAAMLKKRCGKGKSREEKEQYAVAADFRVPHDDT